MKAFIFAILLLTSYSLETYAGWGAPKLAALELRQKTFVEETKVKAADAYKKVSVWFAKQFNDSNSAIKLSDAKESKIVAKGRYECLALKLGNGYSKDSYIEFTVTFQAKDKKIKIDFEDVIGMADNAFDTGSRPSSQEEMDKVSADCLTPLKNEILKTITDTKKDNW